ncbi:MAG: ThuA domain-containing protein [Candidatus Brocadiae bacterium]|nr:ThuA domain-containing protein [Candidatus Brocadiia bacterium]
MSRHSEGWEHSYLPHAEVAIKRMGKESGLYETVTTARSTLITAEELARYDVLIFATTGELPWDDDQKKALLDFVRGGKGFVGIHNAVDTFYEWAEYGEMVGGYFKGHPWTQEVTINVEDTQHPATAMLGESFRVFDEIYTMKSWDRSKTHVLMSLDNASVDLSKGNREDNDYAMGWWHEYGDGRVIYTALGHPDELWDEPWFLDHILACIKWAGRLV